MLKVIIADDERVIRESISAQIDWNSLGLELVGQCKNGIEAYDMIIDESPDIVLTDIKMPGLNGIELISKISGTDYDTQFILLSGYGEFDYARDAMKYGVRDYLLKPCSEAQIIASLKSAMEECYKKRALHRISQTNARDTFFHNIFVEILNEMAMTTDSCCSEIYEPYKKYLDFDETSYDMVILNNLDEKDLDECYQPIWEYHSEHVPGLPLHSVYVPGSLFIFCQDYNAPKAPIASLLDSLSAIDGEQRFSYTSEHFNNLTELLEKLWNKIRHYGTIRYLIGSRTISTCNYRGIIHSVKKLCREIRLIKAHSLDISSPEENDINVTDSDDWLLEKYNELSSILDGIVNPDFLTQLISSILLSFSNDSLFITPVAATEHMIELQGYTSISDIRRESDIILYELIISSEKEDVEQNEIISRIKQYVNDNLSNPKLTLKLIAEKYLFMNVDYLSRCFVHETGKKFSKYLTDTRIQRAKLLLADGDAEKIQSIAEQVGCGNNPQYFSQIFKKNTGMTPSAYAKMIGTR